MWVAIHMCMDTIQEISLYNYLYLKLAKMPFKKIIIFYVFSSTKSEKGEQVLSQGWGEG
jgi:hypothetical protein